MVLWYVVSVACVVDVVSGTTTSSVSNQAVNYVQLRVY